MILVILTEGTSERVSYQNHRKYGRILKRHIKPLEHSKVRYVHDFYLIYYFMIRMPPRAVLLPIFSADSALLLCE